MEETDYDSVEETSSVLSTEEWEDESDSWETDNGLTTEDDCHVNSADATCNPTPAPSTVFIIPPQEGTKAGGTSPTRGGSGENWEGSAASPSSGGGAHHPHVIVTVGLVLPSDRRTAKIRVVLSVYGVPWSQKCQSEGLLSDPTWLRCLCGSSLSI